jgi:hypothetical protein
MSVEQVARRLLAAYPGPLLGADENPWIAKPRDALRARFVRTLMRLGEQLEAGETGSVQSMFTGAVSKPTTLPSRSIAACAGVRRNRRSG